MSSEVGAVLQYGALGLHLAFLVGLFLLIRAFLPKTLDAILNLTATLGRLESTVDAAVSKVDAVHTRMSGMAESMATQRGFEAGTTTGQYAAVEPEPTPAPRRVIPRAPSSPGFGR